MSKERLRVAEIVGLSYRTTRTAPQGIRISRLRKAKSFRQCVALTNDSFCWRDRSAQKIPTKQSVATKQASVERDKLFRRSSTRFALSWFAINVQEKKMPKIRLLVWEYEVSKMQALVFSIHTSGPEMRWKCVTSMQEIKIDRQVRRSREWDFGHRIQKLA